MNYVTINSLQDRDATVVEVSVIVGNRQHFATGASKREPGDPFDARTGKQIALARALSNLANRLVDDEGYEWGKS